MLQINNNRAVVSFANENGNYIKALKRLEESLKKHDNSLFYGLIGESLVGAPLHYSNPYAFKIYCWNCVKQLGIKKILWLDSSVVAVNNLDKVWDKIDEQGYIMQYAGHNVGNWTNERTLNYFNLFRGDAYNMPMYGNAGFLGLNFNFDIANDFFKQWEQSMLDGQFIGSWSDHRHDMACGSIIANRLEMKFESAEDWLHYAPVDQLPRDNKIIFHASGL